VRASSNCRSCGSPIRWCITAANRKRMPVDVDPVDDGNIWIDHTEQGTPIIQVALNASGVPASVPLRYQSHYVSCPQADAWRKK